MDGIEVLKVYVRVDGGSSHTVWSDDPRDISDYPHLDPEDWTLVWERPKPAFKAGDKIRWFYSDVMGHEVVLWADGHSVVTEINGKGREIYDADYLKSATEVVNDES